MSLPLQPCKKSRKDGGSPIVKTITNYFSPVPKPVEKPFSPPRSNNIRDYFSQKSLSFKEKTSSPEQSKENCQRSQSAEKHTSTETAVKQPSQKRRRKATKASRKLVEAEIFSSAEEESCLIVEECAAEPASSCGVLGSDTAALLAQLSAEDCITAVISERQATKTISVEQDEHHNDSSECGNHVKPEPELRSIALSPVVPSNDKAKQIKTTARNSRKSQQQETKHTEPEEKEVENSLCDVSMEGNVDEASQLNNSTVTISFEEFVRSQSQDKSKEDIEDEQDKGDESKITTEVEEMDSEQLDIPKVEENMGSGEPSLQVSPRTVTIQAEVHVVSPKQEAVKPVGKVASIFNRRRGAMSPAEVASPPHTEAGHQLPPTSLTFKRKSNVVLQEEDLELAVLESEFTPKCSEAEKKQFMAAFKQPSLDGSKTKPGKSQGKQRQPGEKIVDAADKVAEEDTVIPPSVEQVPPAPQEKKVAKKKQSRKGKKKAEAEKEEVTTSPAVAAPPAEEMVATNAEVDDKREELPITSTPTVPAVRRSRREAVVRQAPKATPTSPIRNTRKQHKLKDAAASPQDTPVKMSTQKTCKSKHGVFVAEMVCPPDKKESPIR